MLYNQLNSTTVLGLHYAIVSMIFCIVHLQFNTVLLLPFFLNTPPLMKYHFVKI